MREKRFSPPVGNHDGPGPDIRLGKLGSITLFPLAGRLEIEYNASKIPAKRSNK